MSKRILDIVASMIAIVILAIPVAIICAYIAIRYHENPIYTQTRIGKGGKKFKLLKIRTMESKAPQVATHKMSNHAYVTPIGHVLRKIYADETPQFINVLKGDMSIIGPRPLTEEETNLIGKAKETYLSIRPGITGYWQVMRQGLDDYDFKHPRRLELEMFYIEHHNLKLDIWICKKTVAAIVKRTGI